jgi:D-alanine-D-alanine ligase-like ATP-grasp enzyme
MKLHPQRVEHFREAIGASGCSLTEVEVYPGATRYSPRSVVLCAFEAKGEALIKAAAEEASRLVSSRLGIQMTWGVEAHADEEILCWVEYFPAGSVSARFTLEALQAAFVAVAAARSGNEAQLGAARREMQKLEKFPAREIFVQSQFLITAARAADIPVHNVGGTSVGWQFGWGSRSDIFFMTASTGDSVPGHQMTLRKNTAKNLFRELGFPTPSWRVLRKQDDALRAAQEIGWPCVVKPVDQAFGTGITANIGTEAELGAAVFVARQYSRNILIEAHELGADHRLMVVDGRLIVAVRRDPPFVTGDGKRSISELLAELNRLRDGTRENNYLLPVKPDAALDARLASQGLSMQSVLPDGTTLALSSVANFSAGGFATDVTSEVHPQIKGLAELLATSLGLRTAGIDYITTDISRSHAEVGGGFIEVNAMPRLRLLMAVGHPEEEIGALVLGERPGRIPVILIVGNGEALAELAEPVRTRTAPIQGAAAAAADWAQLGATTLPTAGMDAFAIVTAAIRNLAVNKLVILWSAAQIQEFGLPVDKYDRIIVIDRELDEPWLSGFCPDIIFADGATGALEAAFR